MAATRPPSFRFSRAAIFGSSRDAAASIRMANLHRRHRPDEMPGGRKFALHRANAELAEVEQARREHRVSPRVDGRAEMMYRSGTAARNDGNEHGLADCRYQLEVESGLRPVSVYGVQQDLPGAELGRLPGPADRVDSC